MEFRRALVDELGCITFWCSDLTNEEIDQFLDDHPEWSIECIQIN